jgi:hypothetical protein
MSNSSVSQHAVSINRAMREKDQAYNKKAVVMEDPSLSQQEKQDMPK